MTTLATRLTAVNTRLLTFSVFSLLLLAGSYPHLQRLWHFSQRNVHYSHFVLIGPVAIYLIWSERRRIFSDPHWSTSGLAVLLPGLLLWSLAPLFAERLSESGNLALVTLALLITVIGGFVVCFGWPAARVARFALFFLLFAVPFPESILNRVVTTLQMGSADAAGFVFSLVPTPVFREGTVFSMPGLTIEVAPECSGIRSAIALFITCVLGGYFMLKSLWRRSLLAALAIPVAILKNGLRIVTLSLLSIYADPDFIQGSLHTRGAILPLSSPCS